MSLSCVFFILFQNRSEVLEILACEVYLLEKWIEDGHSRKGIKATRPLSSMVPFHLSMRIQFSGCSIHESGFVSTRMTFDRSRFKYDRSCCQLGFKESYLDDFAINVSGTLTEESTA
jgi:hypothetical protein